jgi:micrococcal nuclease
MENTRNYEPRRKIFSVVLLLLVLGLTTALALNIQNVELPRSVRQVLTANQPGLYDVTQIHDGDTIQVDMNGATEKIRMIGVDTPETKDPRKTVECYGNAAADFTRQLIGNNDVRLEADSQSNNRDRYDRLLRYVYLPDGRLVQAEIIKSGYGFAYTSFPFEKSEEFKRYQQEAEENSRGLWSNCQPYYDAKGYIHSSPE